MGFVTTIVAGGPRDITLRIREDHAVLDGNLTATDCKIIYSMIEAIDPTWTSLSFSLKKLGGTVIGAPETIARLCAELDAGSERNDEGWCGSSRFGLSSNHLRRVLRGDHVSPEDEHYPFDIDSFKRCLDMLEWCQIPDSDLARALKHMGWRQYVLMWTPMKKLLASGKLEVLHDLLASIHARVTGDVRFNNPDGSSFMVNPDSVSSFMRRSGSDPSDLSDLSDHIRRMSEFVNAGGSIGEYLALTSEPEKI